VVLFRAAALCSGFVFLAAGGVASLRVPWGAAGAPFPGFTPELHRWHSALLGVSEGILLPGLLLGLWRRPAQRPGLLRLFVLTGVSLVLPHLLLRGSTPVASAFLLLPVITYPALGRLPRASPGGRWDRRLLALAALVAVALLPDLWANLSAQLAGAGGEHARHGHWGSAVTLDLALIVLLLAASSRRPGWTASLGVAACAFAYLGAAALAIPAHAGSWGRGGGVLALGAAAAMLAVRWLGRRDDGTAPAPAQWPSSTTSSTPPATPR
jgi:hypothetical protein